MNTHTTDSAYLPPILPTSKVCILVIIMIFQLLQAKREESVKNTKRIENEYNNMNNEKYIVTQFEFICSRMRKNSIVQQQQSYHLPQVYIDIDTLNNRVIHMMLISIHPKT